MRAIRHVADGRHVLHLLNHRYDEATDSVTPVVDLRLRIPWRHPDATCTMLEPGDERRLDGRVGDGVLTVDVPTIEAYRYSSSSPRPDIRLGGSSATSTVGSQDSSTGRGWMMTIDQDVLGVARSVRTSDVADALDSIGLQERHQLDPRMRPMFPGIRFAGIAHPMAYDLIDEPLETMSYEEFSRRQYASGPGGLWREAGTYGAADEVLVIDAKGTLAGILGSANTLSARTRGTVGFVIDGSCRDSFECTIQQTPLFCTVRSPAHPMGRIRAVSDGEPIVCAGAPVRSGDLVVADDDGVIVVPHEIAAEVVDRARRIQDADRPGRRESYAALGLPLDETVQ